MHDGVTTVTLVLLVIHMIKYLAILTFNLMLNKFTELMAMNKLQKHPLRLEPMCVAVLDRLQVIVAVNLTNEALAHQHVLLIDRCNPPWSMSSPWLTPSS